MRKYYIATVTVVSIAVTFLLMNNFSAHQKKSSQVTCPLSLDTPEGPKSEAMEAIQWLDHARAYPNAVVPADAYVNAMTQFNSRFGNNQTAVVGTWTSIGPNNVGGRTVGLAIDPTDTNKIWIGSASGGLWKSTVGGMGTNAWTYVPIGFPVLGVAAIAINPVNTQEMYIGTGETYNAGTFGQGLTDRTTRGSYGMGIFKSADGGATWTQSLNWTYQQNRCVWEIVVNPLRPNTVFAATSEGVYKSTDAGANWNQVLNVPMCMDLALLSSDTTVIMCGAGDMNSANKGLYRSTNGGLTWALAGNGFPNTSHQGRITISLYSTNDNIAIAQLCDVYNTMGIYKTTDKGNSWNQISTYDICGYQGWYCKGMAIQPGNQGTVLCGGVNMMESTDGGVNYTQVSDVNWFTDYMHSDVHDIIVNPQNPNSIYIITDGGLFRSWDFGTSYTECTDGYVTSQGYIGSISQTNPNFALMGLQDNYTQEYTGSVYWTGEVGGDGCYNAIDPTDDFTSFAAYQYLNICQSTDQGLTYNQVLNMPSSAFGGNPAGFLAPYLICPSQVLRLYGGGTGLYRSDDGGGTWPVVSADPIDNGNFILSIGVSKTYEDSVYIATAPDISPMHLMLSTDGGVNFSDRSTGLPNRYPSRITVNPFNSKVVYVVFSGFGTGHVFKSINAGVTWTDIGTTLPDVPFHCLTIDPQYPNVLYAGSDMGLYLSTDGGATWNPYNTGIPDWTVVFDIVTCAQNRSMFCVTHGHGAWTRSLNDAVTSIGETPTQTPFSISVYPNPVRDNATLSFGESTGPVQISIHDISGKLIYSQQVTLDPASPLVQVNVSEWASGCYFAEAMNGNRKATTRILKN
jgi:photosystem II stability/assembly factor-like uncharacterized protein